MQSNAVLDLLRTETIEDHLYKHLLQLVGKTHLVDAWMAANAALRAVESAGDWNRQVEVRPRAWLTARQVIEGLDLERFCNTHLKALQTA